MSPIRSREGAVRSTSALQASRLVPLAKAFLGTMVAVTALLASPPASASELCPHECPSSCLLSQLREGACDARGECILLPARACANGFACFDAEECLRDCSSDLECASGYVCDVEGTHTCNAAPLSCDGRFLSRDGDYAKPIDCAPYGCRGDRCIERCASSADCASPFVCNELNRCAPAPPDTATDPNADAAAQSCALAIPRVGAGAPIAPLILVAALFVARLVRIRRRGSRLRAAPSARSLLPARRR